MCGLCQCAVIGFDCSLVEFTQLTRRTWVVDQTVSCLIMSQFASTLLLSARAPQSAGLRLRVDYSRGASSCLARSHSPQSSCFMEQSWTNNAHGVCFAINAYRKSAQLLCIVRLWILTLTLPFRFGLMGSSVGPRRTHAGKVLAVFSLHFLQ